MTQAPERPILLRKLPCTLVVARLPAARPVARWMLEGAFASVTRTPDELSVIVEAARLPEGVRAEGPFATFAIDGPLDFSLTGILSRLTAPLAEAAIPVFVSSTFDTDYVLVRVPDATRAEACWRAHGIAVDSAIGPTR